MQRPVPRRRPGGSSRGSSSSLRRDLGPVPARHDRPSVRDHVRPRRRPAHQPLRRGRPQLALHRDARDAVTASTSGASNPSLERTPLCTGVSSTLHESQSRLWENVVGRSLPFWSWFYPRVQETFPEQLGGVPLETSTGPSTACAARSSASMPTRRATACTSSSASSSSRSSSRARLAVADLPDAWNARFEELMGIPVPNDSLGVLQDAHWAGGGSATSRRTSSARVLSVQIWEQAREAIPDVEEQIGRGEFGELHDWLRENIYALGRKLTPAETDRARRRRPDRPAALPRVPARQARARRRRRRRWPKRFSARARARAASTSRSRGGALRHQLGQQMTRDLQRPRRPRARRPPRSPSTASASRSPCARTGARPRAPRPRTQAARSCGAS